jgi:hypothetical protein
MNTRAGDAQLAGWVDEINDLAVSAAEFRMRTYGLVPAPYVCLLVDGFDPPYVAMVICRPFYRGTDAERAIATLGVLPSALGATRLVLSWELADLYAALELPGADQVPSGVVVVDADRYSHRLRWHPMTFQEGPPTTAGDRVTAIPTWGEPEHVPGAALPTPVGQLLALWRTPREWPEDELVHAVTALEQAGYELRWLPRQVQPHHPRWAQLLAPLMQ